jgi:hypothetical protein
LLLAKRPLKLSSPLFSGGSAGLQPCEKAPQIQGALALGLLFNSYQQTFSSPSKTSWIPELACVAGFSAGNLN